MLGSDRVIAPQTMKFRKKNPEIFIHYKIDGKSFNFMFEWNFNFQDITNDIFFCKLQKYLFNVKSIIDILIKSFSTMC